MKVKIKIIKMKNTKHISLFQWSLSRPWILFLSILLLLTYTSCQKLVEVDAPKNKLSTESVFATSETANAAVTAIYSKMNSSGNTNPYLLALYCGIAADELKTYSETQNVKQFYQNAPMPSDAVSNSIWALGYNCIYQANAVIEGCANSTALNQSLKIQLTGEAFFIRAFWHFYLVNFFGEIPLITTTDYLVNSKLAKANKDEVFNRIIDDLKRSYESLNSNYVGADGLSIVIDRVRPNQYAAAALLARVLLYVGKVSEAEHYATTIIEAKPTYKLTGLSGAFLKNSSEAIWQLMMPTPTQNLNTFEGAFFILTNRPVTSAGNSSTLSDQLLAAFESNDQRKNTWVGKFTDVSVNPKVDYYFPSKYKIQTSATISECSTVFRIGEMYLVRAEARAKQGLLDLAVADLDSIRSRAGLQSIRNIYSNINQDQLLTAIIQERRVELFCEYGHRWLDIKRTGKVNDIMVPVTKAKGGTWDANFQLWPIPQKDIENNNNIKQNQGYN